MHKLREVKELEISNETFELEGLNKLFPEFECVEKGKYFPYNYIYDDDRWGCAWRAIQVLLSAHGIDCEDFKQLFHTFSYKEDLMKIIEEKKMLQGVPKQKLKQAKWAPQQNEKNWAEPFIGKVICEKYKLPTQLLLINGYPSAYAPQECFQSTINFECLWKLVKSTIPFSPLMIDDAQIALSIVGYFEESQNRRHLILADPHIQNNRQIKTVGIYKVTLDQKGKQLEFEFPVQDSKKYHLQTYNRIDFETKKWMVLRVLKQE